MNKRMQFAGGIDIGPMNNEIVVPTSARPERLDVSIEPALFNCGGSTAGVQVIDIGDISFTLLVRCTTLAQIRWTYETR